MGGNSLSASYKSEKKPKPFGRFGGIDPSIKYLDKGNYKEYKYDKDLLTGTVAYEERDHS